MAGQSSDSGESLSLPYVARGKDRPDAPKAWKDLKKGPAGVTTIWHHVIPYSRLRDVWNTLVRRAHDTQLPEAGPALHQYLRLCAPKSPEVERWVNAIRRKGLVVHECAHLQTLAMYPPWNFVEGPDPKLRDDDPGDDHMDRYTSGLTPDEYRRMQAVEVLYEYLTEFPADGKNPPPAAMQSAARALRAARQYLVCEYPISFRVEMWEQGADRKWRKRRSRERVPSLRQSAAGRS